MAEAPKQLQDLTISVNASRLAYLLALLELRGKPPKKSDAKEGASLPHFLNLTDKLRAEYEAHFPQANMDSDLLFFGAMRVLFVTMKFGMAYSAHNLLEKLSIEGLTAEVERYKGLLSVDKDRVADVLKKVNGLSPAELTALFEQIKRVGG